MMAIEPNNIIAFSGAHGTGKSTSCYEKAYQLKLSQRTEVGVILEVARQCPYPIFSKENSSTTKESQLWIFSAQLQAELNAVRRYGVVVSDRTVIDTIAYTAAAGMYSLAYSMRELAVEYCKTAYKEVHFRRINDHDYLVDDGFRDQTQELRQNVEMAMLTLYSELGIKLIYDEKE
jgi:cytidylate kinase